MRPSLTRTVLVSLAALTAATALHAQTAQETVYFTAPSNSILKVTSFPAGSSATVVTDNGTNFKGLVVASEGATAADTRIIVANTTKGGDIRAYTGAGGKLGVIGSLKAANAVAVDSGKNVWAVNADPDGADRLITIPRNGAGYGTPVARSVPGVTLLADVKFVSSAKGGATYKAGDILVLSAKPAKILIFRGGSFLATPFATDFNGTEPAGMAIAPEGEILVTTLQGRILAFTATGQRQGSDFASLSGKKGAQVSVGLQGGQPRVFATVTTGGAVLRYTLGRTVSGQLVGTLEYSVASNVPFGVGNASLTGVAYTPASNSAVSVLPVTGDEITFDKVKTPGVTSGALYVVEEKTGVRMYPGDCPDGKLTIGPLSRCVPAHVRGFSRNGSDCQDDGSGCFYLVFVTTTGASTFLGSTQEHHFEEHDYGFDTTCYATTAPGADPGPMQPRTFRATDDDDPAIVEGLDFTDISTGCGSHIGRGGEFSMFLTGWDEWTLVDSVEYKVARLEEALDSETLRANGGLTEYISAIGQAALAALVADVRSAWQLEKYGALAPPGVDYPATRVAIDALSAYVAGNLGEFSQCPGLTPTCSPTVQRNAPGELIARAESAAFLACGASQDCQRRLVP